VLKKFAGGIIMDIAVHMADMMGWYFGDIANVYAINKIVAENCEVIDNVSAIMEFSNGATGILELSWNLALGARLLEIYGSKGAVRLGFDGDSLEVCTDREKYHKVNACEVPSSQAYFLDGVEGKEEVPDPEDIGRKALAYCEAIRESGEKNKTVVPQI
jgi:predicted dehydrogenase